MRTEGKSLLEQLRDAGMEYLQAKVQLTKVQAYEKIARISGVFFSLLIISLLACFTVLFVGLMFGFLLSGLFNSTAIGFSIVAGVFIIMLVVLVIKREAILEQPISEKIVKELFEDENDWTQQERLPDDKSPPDTTEPDNA